jgi:hypothetical protein
MFYKSALLACMAVVLSAGVSFAANTQEAQKDVYSDFMSTEFTAAKDLETKPGLSLLGLPNDGKSIDNSNENPTLLSLKADLNNLGQQCFWGQVQDYENYGGSCDNFGDGWMCSCDYDTYQQFLDYRNEYVPEMRNAIAGLYNWSKDANNDGNPDGLTAAEKTEFSSDMNTAETSRETAATSNPNDNKTVYVDGTSTLETKCGATTRSGPCEQNLYSPNTDPIAMGAFNNAQAAAVPAGAYRNVYTLSEDDIKQYNEIMKQYYQSMSANFLK